MSTPWHLIDGYMDECLTPVETAELRQWLSSDRQHVRDFILAVHQHRAIRGQLQALSAERAAEAAGVPDLATPIRTGSLVQSVARNRVWGHAQNLWNFALRGLARHRIVFAATASLAILAAYVVMTKSDAATLPEVIAEGNGVVIEEPVTLALRASRVLARTKIPPFQRLGNWLRRSVPGYGPGSVIRVGTASVAHLNYTNEATTIDVKENTSLRILAGRSGKRFELISGGLLINAAPQSRGKPLQIATPMAEVRVVGTKLTLAASGKSTRLSVAEGEVVVKSRSTRQQASVTAGQRVTATVNSPLAALDLRPVTNHFGTGSILREYWNDLRGMKVQDLVASPSFPDRPSGSECVTSLDIESAGPGIDYYGARFRGYLHPPVTGEYTFWIAADDAGQFWLSTDENPGNKRLICEAAAWSLFRHNWWKSSEQESAPIHLEGGKRYFIEALHKEGGGGDFLSVAWETPGSELEVIGGADLSPFEPQK
jgi:hypothetical protein